MALYKYVIADRIDILKNGCIRFTQPDALNDPLEMKPYIERLMTDEIWEDEIRSKAMEHFDGKDLLKTVSENIWKSFSRKERRAQSLQQVEAKVRTFARINPEEYKRLYLKNFNSIVDEAVARQKELVRIIPETINKTIGVLSLTEKPDHHLMWSHYASTFSGFVIAFNENHSFFTTRRSDEDELSGLHKIEYSAERPSIKAFIDFSEEHLSSISAKLFFTKSIQWEYEQEWRMIKPIKEADKINPAGNIYLFTLPPDCITGVILGHKMNPEIRREIIELIRSEERYSHNIELLETVLSERTYDIELKPVESI